MAQFEKIETVSIQLWSAVMVRGRYFAILRSKKNKNFGQILKHGERAGHEKIFGDPGGY